MRGDLALRLRLRPVIGRGAITRIVTAAVQSPSAENCQPWRYHWDGGAVLTVLHHRARAAHAMDGDLHISRLTLGCVLESIALAASAEGLRTDFTVRTEPPAGTAWATVTVTPGATLDPLARVIPRRRTERRLFRGGAVTHPVFATVRAEGARTPGAAAWVAPMGRSLTDYLAHAEGYVWQHENVYRDVMRWVHFGHTEARDGMPWETLGIPFPSVSVMALARTGIAWRGIEALRLHLLAARWMRAQLGSSAGLVCFTVPDGSTGSLVSAGRLALRTWLRLNDNGYAVQPVSPPAAGVFAHATGTLPPWTLKTYVDLFAQGRTVLSDAFGLPPGALPVWLFRTGLAPKGGAVAPRRSVDDVLDEV